MKKTMWSLAAAVLSVGLAMPVLAQDAAPPAGGGHGHRGNSMAAATADLNLTPDQQKTVDAAQADAMTRMKALRDDTSTDKAAKREQSMQIQKDTAAKIRAVLTDDQKTKFDAKMAEAREQMRARRGGGGEGGAEGSAPAPPPPPTPPGV